MATGIIYRIINEFHGFWYVGSTLHEKARIAKHLRHLRKGKHVNKAMQADYNECGSEYFKVEVVRRDIPENELHQTEMTEILVARYETDDRVYNLSRTPRISEAGRKLLSERNLNKLRYATGRLMYGSSSIADEQEPGMGNPQRFFRPYQ